MLANRIYLWRKLKWERAALAKGNKTQSLADLSLVSLLGKSDRQQLGAAPPPRLSGANVWNLGGDLQPPRHFGEPLALRKRRALPRRYEDA